MSKLTDLLHVVQALAPDADVFAGSKATDWINLKNYDSVLFVINQGVGATGTFTVVANMAEDAAGTGSTAIPFSYRNVADTTSSDVPGARTSATASGFTTTAGSNQIQLVEVQASDLDDDSPFVQLATTEVVDSPIDGGIVAILGNPRYAGDTHQTAIA
jgi:hypothetical protein